MTKHTHSSSFSLSAILFMALVLAICVVLPACSKKPSCQINNASTTAVCNIHDTISFGHYGGDPITWIILDKNDKQQYLVISEQILDVQPFSDKKNQGPVNGGSTWNEVSIRSWLNGYDSSYNYAGEDYSSDNFIDAAFTDEEKAKIIPTEVPEHPESHICNIKGEATTDKIFLLSYKEVRHVFTSDESRKADPTSYAKSNAKRYVVEELGLFYWLFLNEYLEYHWWLRSPCGAVFQPTGGLHYQDRIYTVSIDAPIGVRPAMWVQF